MPLLAKVKWGEKLTTLLSDYFKNKSGATAALLEFQNAIPDTKGTIKDGISFDWISDSDPRFGPSLEVIIAGKYGLLPFAALETLTIYEPSDLRDTIWAQAEFGMRKGAKIAGFIPVRYPNSENSEDSAIVRGASTVWTTEESLRATIRRDLAWLLNTLSFESAVDLSDHPWVQKSVLNYGVRDFAGRSLGSRAQREHAREIRAAVLRFEPRLDARTLRVEPVMSTDNFGKISYIIEGTILGVPNLMPVRFRTDIDVETASVEVSE